ncbi:MAG: aquaporin [Humibacter sp.]
MSESTPAAASPVATVSPSLGARLAAEAFGTFLLVFAVVGTAIYAAGFHAGKGGLNVGFLGVALALGLSVVIGAYAFGPVSGGHFNPAVTLGLATAGRFAWRDVIGYIIAQLVGGIVASSILLWILSGAPGAKGNFLTVQFQGASTGYGTLSPGGYGIWSVIVVEIVTTALFLYIILGVTHIRAAAGFAPLAIGLTLTVVALIAIPVSNGSFNPARALATAIYGGPVAIGQVWVTILAPIVGALIAGLTSRFLFDGTSKAVQ